jgi:hypothetical protein
MSRSGPLTSILLKVCSKLININERQHDRMEQDPFSIHCYVLDHIAVGCNRWSSQERWGKAGLKSHVITYHLVIEKLSWRARKGPAPISGLTLGQSTSRLL